MPSSHASRGTRRLRIAIAAVACGAVLAPVPAASAQTGVTPVDTVVGSLRGGVQKPHDYICDENRPEVQAIVTGVKASLKEIYPNLTTMLAHGYAPYVDAAVFGLSGGQGHWLNPGYVEDGHIMNPKRPEGILVDRWNRPIGVMFIADHPYVPGPDMYVAEDGTPCNAWHYHTETLADAYWYAYKYGWSGDTQEGDLEPPNRTPDLMHVWAYGASGENYKYQWNHATPPRSEMEKEMGGDPTPEQLIQQVGLMRLPGQPPKP